MSSSDEGPNIDAATAQKLVKEFEGISNTDEIFAQFMLQENDWDLSKALNAFFADKVEKKRKLEEELRELPDVDVPGPSIESALKEGLLTTRAPETLNVVSWNIDGLDQKNLQKRTEAVCKILELENADIVFLQEVIPETFSYIESKLSIGYECIPGNPGDYFVATLLRRGRIYKDESRIIPFPGSVMGRHLLSVSAHFGQVKLDLLNTHLESTKDHAEERKIQLKKSLEIMKSVGEERNVMFGGDLNMRDKELQEVGGLPPGARDCWEACGRRKEAEFTWDISRNTNLEWPGKFKPRCRFDRIYLKPCSGFSAAPKHFGLIGLQKVSGTQSYPSDHWGLLLKLSLNQDGNKPEEERDNNVS
ncbi:tyrosyl-DNA phosphodiesterase 2-like [Eurytemora carolleeae]|uniref:tyrosyl-DNA phosphodiesterase 2-like n=1 Tax=Eurytemora carolleeae TaxID=1294199 RepID=UPI000C77D836|nr:tyrosyl-DNA phosphodiesterase 2-like [Eurytemora carolleeae]|eukprot:XP_023321755.1 tyrosyl-DNA phosphodiesterase 2-like [Eurytemora affinis]